MSGRVVAAVAVLKVGVLIGWVLSENQRQPLPSAAGPATSSVIDLPPEASLALGTRAPLIGFDSLAIALSPDGRSALLTSYSRGISANHADVLVLSLETLETKVLIELGYDARYLPSGHVVFARSGVLLAVPSDLDPLEVTGAPVPVVSGVAMDSFFARAQFAFSDNGSLVYVPGVDASIGRPARVDHRGNMEFLPVPERLYGAVDLAPDGRRLAVHVADINDYRVLITGTTNTLCIAFLRSSIRTLRWNLVSPQVTRSKRVRLGTKQRRIPCMIQPVVTEQIRYGTSRCLRAGAVFLLGTFIAGLAPPAAGQPIPAADDFQVNTYTTGPQRQPTVAFGASGDFVVVWHSDGSSGPDSSDWSVHGQRYASDGSALGSEFQVNTFTTLAQRDVDVSVDADGGFVVVWNSYRSSDTDLSSWSVQARQYASDGTALGSEFQVNTYTTGAQNAPSVAHDAGGDFVVVWESDGSSGTDSYTSVQGQRYASDGTPLGSEFQVNTHTPGAQRQSDVSLDAEGDFVVVWHSSLSMASPSWNVQGQRYTSDGTALGNEFQINTYSTDQEIWPSVAMDADGDFVVVWQSAGSSGTDSSRASVQGQRYASDGIPLGNEFQVNSYTTDFQFDPSVSLKANGDFVVVWQSDGSSGNDSSLHSIQGQRYTSDGTRIGSEFQVNTHTPGSQEEPSVSMNATGDSVVVWFSHSSNGTDSSGPSIQARRYVVPLFADGFESGDASAWSVP